MAELIYLLTETVGGTDSTGETTPGAPIETPVPGCAVWIDATTDVLTVGDDKTVSRFSVAMPPWFIVEPDQQVKIRDVVHEVDGDAFSWQNFYTNWNPGVVFHTKWVY